MHDHSSRAAELIIHNPRPVDRRRQTTVALQPSGDVPTMGGPKHCIKCRVTIFLRTRGTAALLASSNDSLFGIFLRRFNLTGFVTETLTD